MQNEQLIEQYIDSDFDSIDEQIEDSEDESLLLDPNNIYTLSNPSPDKINYLENIRQMNFFQRIFRKFQEGSLRGTIITWVRMTLGIGLFTLGYYVSQLGMLAGFLFLLIGALLSYYSFKIIFEVAMETKKKSYIANVRNVLGDQFYQISRITLGFDYISIFILYVVAAYNFMQNILLNFGFILSQEDLVNKDKLIFDEYSKKMILIRLVFFSFVYIVSIPNLLKEKMEGMRIISLLFLSSMIILLIAVLATLPKIAYDYQNQDKWQVEYFFKKPDISWISCFFSMMFCYNLQIYALDIKNELLYPSIKRLNKINYLATIFEFLICSSVALITYICLGDQFTPKLIVLRNPGILKDTFADYLVRVLIVIFFLLLIISLPVFNPSTRDYLMDFFQKKNEKYFKIFSLLPLLIVCIFSIIYPFITNILDLFGTTIFSYDAFFIPFLMKLKLFKNKNQYGFGYYAILIILWILTILCITGFIQSLINFIN